MARQKPTEVKPERYAVLRRAGREQGRVKAWQYYSIYGFCRECGETKEGADRVARWCRGASPEETLDRGGYSVGIIEL